MPQEQLLQQIDRQTKAQTWYGDNHWNPYNGNRISPQRRKYQNRQRCVTINNLPLEQL